MRWGCMSPDSSLSVSVSGAFTVALTPRLGSVLLCRGWALTTVETVEPLNAMLLMYNVTF